MESIGGSLRAAREKRNLSVEEIEFETHIRSEILRDLEADEYSNFANLTYARSFLAKYSEYLGVDTLAFQEEFAKPELASVDDYTYLQEPTEVLRGGGLGRGGRKSEDKGQKSNRRDQRRKERERERRPIEQPAVGRPHPILLGALMIGLLAGLYYLYKWGNERAGGGKTAEESTATAGSGTDEKPVAGDPEHTAGATPSPDTPTGDGTTIGPPSNGPTGPASPGGSIIGPPPCAPPRPPASSPRPRESFRPGRPPTTAPPPSPAPPPRRSSVPLGRPIILPPEPQPGPTPPSRAARASPSLPHPRAPRRARRGRRAHSQGAASRRKPVAR